MDSETNRISLLLNRLISLYLPNDLPESVLQKYQAYFLRLLSSCLKTNIAEDENSIKTLMQKKIMQKSEEENTNKHTANAMILRLQELINKISKMKVLHNRKGILYMLYKITEFKDQKQMNTISPIEALFKAKEVEKIQNTLSTNKNNNKMEIENTSLNTTNATATNMTNLTTNRNQTLQQPQQTQKEESSILKIVQKITNKGNPNLDLSESDLIRDILFAFQGVDGNYITYSKVEDGFVIKSTVILSTPVKKIVYQLCEMGWLFRKIVEFIQTNNDISNGLIYQSLCYALKEELKEYYRLIAVLDDLRESEDEQSKSSFLVEDSYPKSLNLRKLYLWSLEPFERLKWMGILCDACKNTKGGALASIVYGYAKQGSPTIQVFVNRILKQVLAPLSNFIKLWVYQGELEDQFEEFFVSINPMTTNENLWTLRYKLNTTMIPCFIDQQIAESILLTGKSVNFLRKCCGVQDWVLNLDFIDISSCLISNFTLTSKFNEFKDWINQATEITSQKLVNVLFTTFKFKEHCESIKKYLLLGQGDFMQYLMDLLTVDLSESANQIMKHKLVGYIDTAVRGSNAQYHDQEFINRLDVKLLDASSGDYGWDIFSLDYRTEAPINTIFNPKAMKDYLRLFNFLWRVKRVEYSLSQIWIHHMKTSSMMDSLKELRGQMHKCNLLRHEMIHFLSNFLNYIMVEVIESAWKNLMDQLAKPKDLNEIIKHHDAFLNQILDKTLLTSKNEAVYKQLLKIFDLVFRFKYAQDILITSAQEEYNKREIMKQNKQMREFFEDNDDNQSNTSENDMKNTIAKNIISEQTVNHLQTLWKDYKLAFAEFMTILKKDEFSGKLRFLNFRLDFNEFYCTNNPKNNPKGKFDVDEFKPKNIIDINTINNNNTSMNIQDNPRPFSPPRGGGASNNNSSLGNTTQFNFKTDQKIIPDNNEYSSIGDVSNSLKSISNISGKGGLNNTGLGTNQFSIKTEQKTVNDSNDYGTTTAEHLNTLKNISSLASRFNLNNLTGSNTGTNKNMISLVNNSLNNPNLKIDATGPYKPSPTLLTVPNLNGNNINNNPNMATTASSNSTNNDAGGVGGYSATSFFNANKFGTTKININTNDKSINNLSGTINSADNLNPSSGGLPKPSMINLEKINDGNTLDLTNDSKNLDSTAFMKKYTLGSNKQAYVILMNQSNATERCLIINWETNLYYNIFRLYIKSFLHGKGRKGRRTLV